MQRKRIIDKEKGTKRDKKIEEKKATFITFYFLSIITLFTYEEFKDK